MRKDGDHAQRIRAGKKAVMAYFNRLFGETEARHGDFGQDSWQFFIYREYGKMYPYQRPPHLPEMFSFSFQRIFQYSPPVV
jgi:hypothetical protein